MWRAVIKPMCTYGIQFDVYASNSNTKIPIKNLTMLQQTLLACGKPYFHTNLKIPYLNEVIRERSNGHHDKKKEHPNPLLTKVLQHFKQ